MAVIFDLDGVLIDSEALQYEAYTTVLARYAVRVSAADYARYWIAEGRGPEYAVQTYGLPLTPDALRALRNPVYHALMRQRATLMPGALAAVERLHGRFPLAIATNSNRDDVGFLVDHFGLARFFAAIVTREDYRRAKPEPDAYLTAAARLNRPAAACLVVEDAYRGIVAAYRAGATAVAVPNEFTRDNDFALAARVLRGLDELTVELVAELLRAHPA